MTEPAATLEWTNQSTGDDADKGLLSTGIDILDRKLGGGIPAGRVVMLSASPASQSELFLYEMAGPRETRYLTTERRVDDVERSLEQSTGEARNISVHRVEPEDPLEQARSVLEEIEAGSTVIVDPLGPLEMTNGGNYRTFLNDLKVRTAETGSIAVLHCLDGRTVPGQRDRTEYLSDVIFDLVTNFRGGSVENSLAVPKFRGGAARSEAIELDLSTGVTIDVSRKIA